MDQLGAMRAFVFIVRTGGFSSAAEAMGATQGALSKRVAALEKSLGVQLLARDQRHIMLTNVGRDYYEKCCSILELVDEAEATVSEVFGSPSGRLLVTMSPVLSRLIIAPIIKAFLDKYPDIELVLRLSESRSNIIAEGIDIAIRAGHLEDSSLIASRISSNPLTLAAAPKYLLQHGEPQHPRDLQAHNCIIFSRTKSAQTWRFTRGKTKSSVPVAGSVLADQGDTLIELAAAGAGIVLMPAWLMQDRLACGQLQKVLPSWKPPSLPIHIVQARRSNVRLAPKLFADYVKAEVRRRKLLPA
jgi:DNA-binding transcriptional LysR family regulator